LAVTRSNDSLRKGSAPARAKQRSGIVSLSKREAKSGSTPNTLSLRAMSACSASERHGLNSRRPHPRSSHRIDGLTKRSSTSSYWRCAWRSPGAMPRSSRQYTLRITLPRAMIRRFVRPPPRCTRPLVDALDEREQTIALERKIELRQYQALQSWYQRGTRGLAAVVHQERAAAFERQPRDLWVSQRQI